MACPAEAVKSPAEAARAVSRMCGHRELGNVLLGTSAPGPVAQLVEQRVYTASVVGSSPAGSTTGVTSSFARPQHP